MLILAINPGSTSTKIAVYEDEQPVLLRNIRHSVEELSQFARIADQRTFRRDLVLSELRRMNILFRFDAIIGRGGLAKPLSGGVYAVNEKMCRDMYYAKRQHVCNLGCIIAYDLARQLEGCLALIADPVVVDEMEDVARVCGSPLMQRVPIWHALNQRAIARRFARENGRRYEELNLARAAPSTPTTAWTARAPSRPNGRARCPRRTWCACATADATRRRSCSSA